MASSSSPSSLWSSLFLLLDFHLIIKAGFQLLYHFFTIRKHLLHFLHQHTKKSCAQFHLTLLLLFNFSHRFGQHIWASLHQRAPWHYRCKGPPLDAELWSRGRRPYYYYLAEEWRTCAGGPQSGRLKQWHAPDPKLPETAWEQRDRCGRVWLCCTEPLWHADQP